MKVSTTVFLAFLLAGVGWYYFSSRSVSPLPQIELAPTQIFSLKEGDSVSWIQLERRAAKETLALRREEGKGWVLEYPVSYPAEGLLVEGIARALKLSRRTRRLALNGKPPVELGLQSPALRIGIETEKEPRQRFLLIGEEAPIGGAFYARWEDEDEYFLMPTQVKAALETSVYSLRRKKLFRIHWNEVERIEIQRGGKKYLLEKKAGRWIGKMPGLEAEISLEKAKELIYALESGYIKDFLDGKNPANHEFRLLADFAFIEVKDAKGAKDKLILGARAKNQEALYAVREKENLVLLVSEAKIRSILADFETAFKHTTKQIGTTGPLRGPVPGENP